MTKTAILQHYKSSYNFDICFKISRKGFSDRFDIFGKMVGNDKTFKQKRGTGSVHVPLLQGDEGNSPRYPQVSFVKSKTIVGRRMEKYSILLISYCMNYSRTRDRTLSFN